jgi:hypothetical protein
MSSDIVIDTPEGIDAYRMYAIRSRLKLEIAGITFRVNTAVAIRRELGLPPRTPRKKVLAAWEAKMREAGLKF